MSEKSVEVKNILQIVSSFINFYQVLSEITNESQLNQMLENANKTLVTWLLGITLDS